MAISTILKQEKNKLSGILPWLVLLDVDLGDQGILYLVRNTEDITFSGTVASGQVYTAFPMDINFREESIGGNIPDVQIRISNVTRDIQAILEALDPPGAIDCEVTMRIIHAGNLSADYSDLTHNFFITAASVDSQWITFTLGLESPTYRRFPLFRTLGHHCNWVFKGYECGYSGATESCDHTLTTCQGFNDPDTSSQSKRFGGYPGLNMMGVKFAANA